jgi:hypothetical protein
MTPSGRRFIESSLQTNTRGSSRCEMSPPPLHRRGRGDLLGPPVAGGTAKEWVYCSTDLGVASMRVTLIASRSSIMGTWGAMTFFQ